MKKGETGNFNVNKDTLSETILKKIENQNISKDGFFIEKAEISSENEKGSEKFLASIKFKAPEKYLISIRSKTGIEVARIFLSHDTVLANDRINRILYYGKPLALKNQYGITSSVLAVVFGDILNSNQSYNLKGSCLNNDLNTTVSIDGIKVVYMIDCKRMKPIKAIAGNSDNDKLEIRFSEFRKDKNITYPERIKVVNTKKKESVEIKVVKINVPWNGNIEFIPGKNYEMIQL
jgi:hypothetical protein